MLRALKRPAPTFRSEEPAKKIFLKIELLSMDKINCVPGCNKVVSFICGRLKRAGNELFREYLHDFLALF